MACFVTCGRWFVFLALASQLVSLGRADIQKYRAPQSGKRTVLEAAEAGSRAGVISALVRGDNIDMKDDFGHTALVVALNHGHVGIARLLIEKGASLNHVDDDGYTPLMYAVHKGHADEVQMLLDEGVDTHTQNRDGFTALMMAAQEGRYKLASLLVNHHTKPYRTLWVGPRRHKEPTTTHGDTAATIAMREGYEDIAKLITDAVERDILHEEEL